MSLKGSVRFVNKEKNLFFPALRKRVDEYFKQNNISRNGNALLVSKSIVFLSLYIIPFCILINHVDSTWIQVICWSIMGLGLAGIGMSIMHDANHNAYSKHPFVNYMMGLTLNLCGGSRFNWDLQHNVMHHTYTNIHGLDEDIEDKLVLRFSPHSNVKGYHAFQYIYAFAFYSILSFYWIVLKDYVQYVKYIKNGINSNSAAKNAVVLIRILVMKTIYFSVFFGVPMYFFNFSFSQVFFGFLLMHLLAGMILTIAFQLAHTVERTSHPLPTDTGIIENDWAIHQMNTTVDFSRDNWFITYYLGGLNFQVEHHLFPNISHVHYPAISKIVEETAKEFGVPYLENKTFGQALKSHIQMLRNLGHLPSMNDAIG